MRNSILSIARVLLFTTAVTFQTGLHAQYVDRKTDWLSDGKIGLSTHYVVTNLDTLDYWTKQFQAEKVANQVASTGAAWFLFTVQHHSWIFLAPNSAFDRIIGSTERTAKRDLPLELSKYLSARNVRLMLYVNIRNDASAAAPDNVKEALGGWPPNDKLIDNIAATYRELSLRYGKRVSGWWIDQAGVPDYRNSPNRERWFKKISDALRAGNPDAVIAFNPGLRLERYSQSDFTAGEMNNLTYLPSGRWVDNAQWHAFTFVGGWWGSGDTRFSTATLIEYASKVSSSGGALTLDVGTIGMIRKSMTDKAVRTPYEGYIAPSQVEQMTQVIKTVKKEVLVH